MRERVRRVSLGSAGWPEGWMLALARKQQILLLRCGMTKKDDGVDPEEKIERRARVAATAAAAFA